MGLEIDSACNQSWQSCKITQALGPAAAARFIKRGLIRARRKESLYLCHAFLYAKGSEGAVSRLHEIEQDMVSGSELTSQEVHNPSLSQLVEPFISA